MIRLLLAGALTAGLVTGCGSSNQSSSLGSSSSGSSTPAAASGKIVVFAAASLKKTFTEIGERLKTDNPGTDVEFSFAGSSDLVTQLTNGAPADVFASADTKNMDKVKQASLLSGGSGELRLEHVDHRDRPRQPEAHRVVQGLGATGSLGGRVRTQVPCGSATKKVEDTTGVTLSPVSEESQVTDVLTKVTSGQADAGLVYVTDAIGAGDKVTAVSFPESLGAVNTYPIAVLKQTKNPDLAKKFVDSVNSEAGQKILSAAGFAKP